MPLKRKREDLGFEGCGCGSTLLEKEMDGRGLNDMERGREEKRTVCTFMYNTALASVLDDEAVETTTSTRAPAVSALGTVHRISLSEIDYTGQLLPPMVNDGESSKPHPPMRKVVPPARPYLKERALATFSPTFATMLGRIT